MLNQIRKEKKNQIVEKNIIKLTVRFIKILLDKCLIIRITAKKINVWYSMNIKPHELFYFVVYQL